MDTDKIASAYRKHMGETQTVVDVILQKSEAPIGRVLVANAQPCVQQIEVLNGEATYSGDVEFNLVYADEQGQVFTAHENAPLRGKIENVALNPLMKPIYNVEVIEVKVQDMDESAKITAAIGLKLDVICQDEVMEVKPTSENIELKSETEKHLVEVSSGTKTITLTEQFDSKTPVQSVALALAEANLKAISAGTGYFTADGEVFVNALLKVHTDEGVELKNFMETLDFKEELEDENLQKGDIIQAFAYVRPQDIKVELMAEAQGEEQASQSQTIAVEVVVTIKYVAMREEECEVYTDAFSMTNKTNLVLDTLVTSKLLKSESFEANIEGQTILDETRISKICSVTNETITVASTKLDAGNLFVEGVANATVVYLTDDDTPMLASLELEVPFSNKFVVNDEFDGEIFATAHIMDIEAKLRKGREITVNFEVCFDVDVYSTESIIVIKDIELAEELPANAYSLEIYVAPRGSTLWDVSKHLLVTEEVLLRQNPNLVFPLESAQSIVHFVQK